MVPYHNKVFFMHVVFSRLFAVARGPESSEANGESDYFIFCGSLLPLTAFPRDFFAEACSRLACNGLLRGPARSTA